MKPLSQVRNLFPNKLIVGPVIRTLLRGDVDCDAADSTLRAAILEFESTLSNCGHIVGFQTNEIVKQIQQILSEQSEEDPGPADAHRASLETYEFLFESVLENTLDRLLEDRRINSLLTTETTNGIFCLRGPPRCGKSCAAAFLIKQLRQPSSRNIAIAYYFFNSARGMTNIRDAINSICCQLESQIGQPTTISRSRLLKRRSTPNRERFPMRLERLIDQTLGYFIHQRLHNIILIIDGVDEADFTILDPVSRKSEMDIFIQYLVQSSDLMKVLLVTRPLAVLRQYIPEPFTISFPSAVADLCIESWVENFTSEHPEIERMFHQAGHVPVAFLREHANGDLTWAQSALKDLFLARRSPSRFRQRLESLPSDPTLLEESYTRTLSNIDDLDLTKEIIYRLAA